jgi:hypothetical protein
MSRFSQAPGKFRVWSPPQSPIRVEYLPGLFQEALEAGSGTLYGHVLDRTIRITNDETGGAPVGIFTARARGEIFLTEEDLQRFESAQAHVALVIANGRAGFFVRQADGSIQSIRSHQELAAPDSAARKWTQLPAAALALVMIALIAAWAMRPQPLALSIREDAGQLRIAFTRSSGQIEISDGAATHSLPLDRSTTSLTYAPQSADIQIRLKSGRRLETARYLAVDHLAELRAQVDSLESEAAALAAESEQNRRRAADLQRTLSKMNRAD